MKYDGRYSLKDALIEADTKDLDEGIIGDVMGKIGGALKKKLKGLFGGDSGLEIKEMSLEDAGEGAREAINQLFFNVLFKEIDDGTGEKEAEAMAKKEIKNFLEQEAKSFDALDLQKNKDGNKEEEK
tara:strand:- start:1387 stop:1767 length:381 start_codon:yes stop_codon:yes gene_type:complete